MKHVHANLCCLGYTFDAVPGNCSVSRLLKHYELAEEFFKKPFIPQEAIDLIKKEHL